MNSTSLHNNDNTNLCEYIRIIKNKLLNIMVNYRSPQSNSFENQYTQLGNRH